MTASGQSGGNPVTGASSPELRITDNRAALAGFGLSLLQLAVHLTWMALIGWLSGTGQAAALSSDSPASWAVVVLLGVGFVITIAALFVCLVYGLRRPPRTLAVVGIILSFFAGVLVTAVVLLSLLRYAATMNAGGSINTLGAAGLFS